MFDLYWGENTIEDAGRFVDAQGRIYMAVRFPSEKYGAIYDIRFTITGVTAEGKDIVVGWKK